MAFLTRRTGPAAAPLVLYDFIDAAFAMHSILPKTSQHLGYVENLLGKIKAGGVRSVRQFAQLSDFTALTVDERFAEQGARFEEIELDVAQLIRGQREQRTDHEDLAGRVGALERERDDDDEQNRIQNKPAPTSCTGCATRARTRRAGASRGWRWAVRGCTRVRAAVSG